MKDPYFSAPGVSSHMLADFRRDGPAYFYRKHVMKAIEDRDSAAFAFGRGLHALVLEGGAAFHRSFIEATAEHLTPSGTLSTKAATKEWKAQQDKSVLTPNEVRLIHAMSVRVHDVAGKLFASGEAEVERFETHGPTGLALKGRADWHAYEYGVDLKSCGNLDHFEADARRYGYVEQGAFYCALFGWERFFLVACEKDSPNRVGIYQVTEGALTRAYEANEAALRELAQCYALDSWSDNALVLVA